MRGEGGGGEGGGGEGGGGDGGGGEGGGGEGGGGEGGGSEGAWMILNDVGKGRRLCHDTGWRESGWKATWMLRVLTMTMNMTTMHG